MKRTILLIGLALLLMVSSGCVGEKVLPVKEEGQLTTDRAIESLIQALKDDNSSVREEAAYALWEIRDARAVDPLIQALKDEDEYVREQVAVALGMIGDPRAVDPLIQVLKEEPPVGGAAWALGEIADERAVDPLIQALKDEDEYVRGAAVVALGKIGDPRAIEPLMRITNDENEDDYVRRLAKEAVTPAPTPLTEREELKKLIVDQILNDDRGSLTARGRSVSGATGRAAYSNITRGVYDFNKDPVNVLTIRLFVDQVSRMDIPTLQRIVANPTISTDDLADLKEGAPSWGSGASPAMVIGYAHTVDPTDGDRIYGSIVAVYPGYFYYFDDPTA